MLPANVDIPGVLRVEDKVAVVALVCAGEVDVFNVAGQGVSAGGCLLADTALVSHHSTLLFHPFHILDKTLLVHRRISCRRISNKMIILQD